MLSGRLNVNITTCSSSTITTHQLAMTRPGDPKKLVNTFETLTDHMISQLHFLWATEFALGLEDKLL